MVNEINRLHNKNAIIIGGSRGIGLGIAKVFSLHGANVVIAAREETTLEEAKQAILACTCVEVETCVVDITDRKSIKRLINSMLEKWDKIDILCQNAGIFPEIPVLEMSDKDWDLVLDTNLKGTFQIISEVIPEMRKQKYGKIVITSSITGPRVGSPGLAHYGASKSGINGFVKTAAIELAPYNITINCVEPGNILTEQLQGMSGGYIEAHQRAIPMGHLGTPEDIGYAASFLASDESRYITGQSIIVDGGQVLPESHFALPQKDQ